MYTETNSINAETGKASHGKIDPNRAFIGHRCREVIVGRNVMTVEKSFPRNKTSVGVRVHTGEKLLDL